VGGRGGEGRAEENRGGEGRGGERGKIQEITACRNAESAYGLWEKESKCEWYECQGFFACREFLNHDVQIRS
jgi:hypothetical protein